MWYIKSMGPGSDNLLFIGNIPPQEDPRLRQGPTPRWGSGENPRLPAIS